MVKKEKLNLDKEVSEKKEKEPVQTLTGAVVGILHSITKVKDLRDAVALLVQAQEMEKQGKKKEAKDLALKIFQQLKGVGANLDDIPEVGGLKTLVVKGEYGKLAKIVTKHGKKIKVNKPSGIWKELDDDVVKTGETLDLLQKRKTNAVVAGKITEGSVILGDSAKNVDERAVEIARTERDLSVELQTKVEELVTRLEGVLAEGEKEELKKEWNEVVAEIKFSGRAEVSLNDVENVKKELMQILERDDNWNEAIAEVKKGINKGDNKLDSLSKAYKDKGSSTALIVRTKELARLLVGIESKLKQGVSFEQVCTDLGPQEVNTVRQWMRGLGKKDGEVGYDLVISELGEKVFGGQEGQRLLVRFMENVNAGYEVAQETKADADMESRFGGEAGHRLRAGEPLVIDPRTGGPAFGLEEGASGMSRRGLDFLREVSGDADWVQDWVQAETAEQYQKAQEKQHATYRAEMMNVSFDALMEDEGVSQDFKDLLDVESFSKGQVARIRAEFRNDPEKRARFQALWLQEMLTAQRLIAYEGVFQGAHYDARITRYNTLMSIMDISTSIKGYAKLQGQAFNIVDLQQNSYLDEAALEGLIKPLLSQGPDFRVEHMFKTNRENIYVFDKDGVKRSIGDIGLYDVVHKLKMRVEDVGERAAMEMPRGITRHYGTMMERHSEEALRTRNRKTIFFSLMNDLGVNLTDVDEIQKDMVYNMYQSYLDEGIYYLWAKKQLHQAVGNASFEKNKFDLCQALPEMLYKTDPFLVLKYFQRYSVGGQLKDAFVFGDSGMRDEVSMAPNDYAQHLLEADTNNLGAPGIRQVFFGNRKDSKTEEYVNWFAQTMKESIFHYGYYDKNRKVTMVSRIGSSKNIRSGTRRPDAEIIDKLREKESPKGFVKAIDWGTKDNPGIFAKLVVDPKLVAKLTSNELSPEQKWDVFIGRFGEDYLNMESASAKRVEHMSKYGLTQHFTWYKNYLAWQLAPVNNTKIIDMFTPLAAVNAGIAPIIAEHHLEFQGWGNEKLGRKELGGGRTRRVKRNENGQIQFDTSYGFLGEGDSEWAGLDDEEIRNDRGILDPVQRGSIFEASGVAGYQDEFALKALAEDMFRAGLLTEGVYKHFYKEDFAKSLFWAKKKGLLPNLWNWVTGEILFEYMGNVWFGIPGHMLREAWWEPTKETGGNLLKYITGSGGH